MKRTLLFMGLLALLIAPAKAKNYRVNLNYYADSGESEFGVTTIDWHALKPSDTITFYSDDPGILRLQMDDGKRYEGRTIMLKFKEIQRHSMKRDWTVRCSMITSGGVVGFEAGDCTAGFPLDQCRKK